MSAKVRVKSTLNTNKAVKDYQRGFNRARMMVKSEIVKDCDPLTPKSGSTSSSNSLIKSVITSVRDDSPYLAWNKIYARFLSRGKVMIGSVSRRVWAKKYEKKIVTGRDLQYNRSKNPKAGSNWFEKAKKTKLGKWLKIYAKGGEMK